MVNLQVKTYFDQLAKGWQDRYSQRADYLERSRVFRRAIISLLREYDIRCVLEIGCGAMSMFDDIPDAEVDYFATDVSFEMLKRNVSGAYLFQADIFKLPLRTAFDMVILSSVIEWLDEPERVPGLLRRLVNPGGVLLASYPNSTSVLRWLERNIIRRSKVFVNSQHYTDIQTGASYALLESGFASNGFALQQTDYFGKKLFRNGRLSSSLRLDTYIRLN